MAQMSSLVIDETRCRGCRRCVKACANGALSVEGRLARVSDACVLCGLCVDACSFGAIRVERDEDAEGQNDLASYRDVWVFCQVDDGAVVPVAYELLGKGRELADELGMRLVAVCGLPAGGAEGGRALSEAGRATAEGLVAAGADEVLCCADARLAERDAGLYAGWLARLVGQRKPAAVLFGATVFGRELAPAVAARVQTGLTADCTVLAVDPATGLLQQTRPAFGGNLMATIVCPNHRPQMATVRPGVLPAPVPDPARHGTVTLVGLEEGDRAAVRVVERIRGEQDDLITDAELLVVAGRGIGSQKNLELVRRLADKLGGKLGCSRPLVEAGWCAYKHQVGQTGVSVAPKTLISVGVSGAIQHLAGIGGAERVIAINSDPDAPIFGVSQYAVVGDCVEVLKEWLAALDAE
jgi:electron transfer flavoprotein alpha subunit